MPPAVTSRMMTTFLAQVPPPKAFAYEMTYATVDGVAMTWDTPYIAPIGMERHSSTQPQVKNTNYYTPTWNTLATSYISPDPMESHTQIKNNNSYTLTLNDIIERFDLLRIAANAAQQQQQPYVCHICGIPGHDIKSCPQGRPMERRTTPYQGTKRCFGLFHCNRCNRKWMSGNSWSNTGQQCMKCGLPVFPHKQRSLDSPDGLDRSDQSKVHPQHLCLKCKTLGFYCREQQTFNLNGNL